MKKKLLNIILIFVSVLQFQAQEDGVVALDLPVRNSLKFNRYAINPTFSFVREQNKYISFSNKRQWVQFDNAPLTYLFSYSGRFSENIGAGLGLFQQNYGVLTTFGGLLNFAYNVTIDRDQNLTFGINLGVYSSGINTGKVVSNFPDPSLDNIPSNLIATVNPGINYGTKFFDFGISINNLVSYNSTSSKLIEENTEESIQGHIMLTGYMKNSRGFFDQSKFTGLVRSEFKQDETVISGLIMLMVPKGIWAQAGYNTLFGVSGGIGLNITSLIALEYNYEQAIGDLSNFGNSHEITLAYKLKNKSRYRYSGDDREEAFIIQDAKPKQSTASSKPVRKTKPNDKVDLAKENQSNIRDKQKIAQEIKAKEEAEAKLEEQVRIAAENKSREESEAIVRKLLEEKSRQEAEEQARIAAENKAIEESETKQEEQARIAAENKAREASKAIARKQLEEKSGQEAEAKKAEEQARIAAVNKAREASEAIARKELEEKSRQEAEAKKAEEQPRIAAENKAKEASEAIARKQLEEKSRQEAEAKKAEEQARIAAENKAREASEAIARKQLEEKSRQEEEAEAKLEEQARIAAENKAREASEAIARKELEEKSRQEAEAKKAEEQARIAAENKAKEASEAIVRKLLEEKSRQEEEKIKAETEAKAKQLAQRKERLEAEQRIDTIELDGVLIPVARDREALAIQSLTELTQNATIEQQDLLKRLRQTVASRQLDLDDLKEENDLSEQGIYKAPKAFKSISAENAALESLKSELDVLIISQDNRIAELERLYNERLKRIPEKDEEVNAYYLKAIANLKSEQEKATEIKKQLFVTLEEIKVATEFERKRRIKRAAYDNEEDRYAKDRAALNLIKQNTKKSTKPLKVDDFDFGDAESDNNIQIVKDVINTKNGYYLVIAIHDDVSKRDKFLTNVISSGNSNIDFFFDLGTNKYYIYSQKFDDIESAKRAIQSKDDKPYNSKLSLFKIEN